MGIFSSIMEKIFRHGSRDASAAGRPQGSQPASGAPQASGTGTSSATSGGGTPATPAAPAQPVDVEAVLTDLAKTKGGGGNWRTSIVDLLKLLDLDSSLEARKELASELKVNAGAHGSAEQNIALHKAVMAQLAANGGKVPASLRD